MKEEKVTKIIIEWLYKNDWKIICYDFPQSGTGVMLHQNKNLHTTKNKGSIIPDIIAVKKGKALFFENKNRFYEPDFNKLQIIKNESSFSDSLYRLLMEDNINKIFYGVGIPTITKEIKKSQEHFRKIDFLVSANKEKEVQIHHDPGGAFNG